MKAKEAAAEKKKPKTSAAQIRVQKGKRPILSLTWHSLFLFPLSLVVVWLLTVYNLFHRAFLDLAELEIPSTIEMTFPDPADILNFEVNIRPDDGKGSRSHWLLHAEIRQSL